jgi:hypothetical protein
MKLSLKFGQNEPLRQVLWWNTVDKFFPLVKFKDRKWEFVMWDVDRSGDTDYELFFREVSQHDSMWQRLDYQDIGYLIGPESDSKCTCGAIYSSFPWDHMRFCNKWTKF